MDAETLQECLGRAIRTQRVALSLSQEAFADRIGMHRAYYSAIERGERNLTIETLGRVASGLKMSISQLAALAGV